MAETEQYLTLGLALDRPSPAVDGFHHGEQIDARRQPRLDERPGKGPGVGVGRQRREDDDILGAHLIDTRARYWPDPVTPKS